MESYAELQSQPLILIADDDRIVRYIMQTGLNKMGYRTKEVGCGLDCLAACQQERPALVILDVRMPDMDGFECCRQLKALPQGNQIAVLIMTGLEDASLVNWAFAAGASDYMTKPIHWAELKQRVQTFIDSARVQRQLEAVQ